MVKVSQLFRSYFGIFYSTRVRRCVTFANNATSRELLQRITLAYEHLPTGYNKELESGIKAVLNWRMDLLSSVPLLPRRRYGSSFNLVFLDEFAFVESHMLEDFFRSVYPTITSGHETKMIIVSTPKGMNHYYKMWMDGFGQKVRLSSDRSPLV